MVERHPFPGPGLAIRILCAEEPYRLENHTALQKQLDSFVKQAGYDNFKAHLLPVRTVGVQGDGRSYKYLAGISGPRDWDRLYALAAAIPNNNHAINRVCYVFEAAVARDKLGVTPTRLTLPVIEQLQEADAIVTEILYEYDLLRGLSQMPVVLFPIDFGVTGDRAIALRPFKTPDFMTGIAGRPGSDIPEVALQAMITTIIEKVPGISRVVLDLSSKPPGTTEWE